MIMSVGVIIAALIIYIWPDLWYMDPFCTYFFSIIVVVTTIPIIKNCMKVMMEAAPEKINVDTLRSDLYKCNEQDIQDVHDLHVWTIAPGKISMTVHVVSLKPLKSLARVTDMLRRKYDLHHTTV